MPSTHPRYPPEFRKRLVDLVRAGRGPESLAREFKVTAVTIRKWVEQAELDAGRRTDGLTTEERRELTTLRRRVRVLEEEREIPREAAAWFAKESTSGPKRGSDS